MAVECPDVYFGSLDLFSGLCGDVQTVLALTLLIALLHLFLIIYVLIYDYFKYTSLVTSANSQQSSTKLQPKKSLYRYKMMSGSSAETIDQLINMNAKREIGYLI